MAARSSPVLEALGDGLLLALIVIFAAVTFVFALGLIYGLVHAALVFIVPQAVMVLAFGALTMRLLQVLRQRRAAA